MFHSSSNWSETLITALLSEYFFIHATFLQNYFLQEYISNVDLFLPTPNFFEMILFNSNAQDVNTYST